MERQEIVNQLIVLKTATLNYEEDTKAVNDARSSLEEAKSYMPSRLSSFDEHYKKKYVLEQIGPEPKPLGKWNPLNLSKKKREAAETARKEYAQKKACAEEDFYKLNEKKRRAFEKEDAEDKASRIAAAEKRVEIAKEKIAASRDIWSQDTLLSERLRNVEAITKILELFEDGRVDSIKEAVNLYYDELRKDEEARLAAEHREKMEKAIEDQNIAIQDLVDKVNSVSSTVDEAVNLAREAIDKANDAYNRADEAYNNAGSQSY